MAFDPTSLGLVAVEEEFDPASLGLVPVKEEFDPTSLGLVPVEDAKGTASELASGSQGVGIGGTTVPLTDSAAEAAAGQSATFIAGITPGKFDAEKLLKYTTPAFVAHELATKPLAEVREETSTPVMTLPKPSGPGVSAGLVRGGLNLVDALTTPENIALAATITGAPEAIQRAAGGAFAVEMGRHLPEQYQSVKAAETPGDVAEKAVELVGSAALALLGAKHAIKGPKVTEVLTTEAAKGSRPEGAPAEAPLPQSSERAPSSSGEIVKASPETPVANADEILARRTNSTLPVDPPEISGPLRVFTEEGIERPAKKFGVPFWEKGGGSSENPDWTSADAPPGMVRAVAPQASTGKWVEGWLRPDGSFVFDRTGSLESWADARDALIYRAANEAKPVVKSSAETRSQNPEPAQAAAEAAPAPAAEPVAPPELLPKSGETAPPKLDTKRSVFALGISPDNKAVNWLTANVKRLFTAKGDLPKETFEGWIGRNGFVKEQSRQTAYAVRDLYTALKKEFGISTTETLTKGFEKVPREFVGKMNQALLGEVDINTLPESVRVPLQAMRQHVDALSQKMIDEGVVPESLKAKVAENLGVYMTRSYRVFDDPVWADKIPQDVRNRARDFILSNLQKTDPAATPATANSVMKSMLQDWKDQGSGALVKGGGKIGSKDLTSFIERKDIPKVIREVMGEYHDPSINYTRSVTKMANLIGSQRFLNEVRTQGMGKFLFEDGKQPATHTALIAAEGSDVMAPLNGLRTTPEIAAAFREFGKTDPIKNGILRALATFSGLAKSVKTVGSAMTQARNALGQAYFFAMNGHFDMTKAAPAIKAVLADIGAHDTPAGRAAYQRYLRLGIVDQSARASELRDIIRDSGLNDPGVTLTEPGHILARTAKKLTVDAAARAYQITDDLGKIIGFENELARQKEIHPDWSQETLEATSAERIRNTYPTYSMVPKAVQNLRRLPIAPFASFAAETFRTAYHNLRYTIEDLQSSNPAQKKAGAQRLAGQLAVAGSGFALTAISQAFLGMNAQDEDDARRFMAPWDKDSQIMFTGKGPGESKFVNVSYVNPYSYLTDPVVSVASGLRDQDQLDEVMLRSLGKLLQPFTSEDIFASALVDIARNQTQTGRRVFNPGDTPAKRWEDKMSHVLGALEPGTSTRIRTRIIPAITGETDKSGRKPELTTEVLNELTGFKQQTIDYQQAVGFKAREFKKADDDADTIFREVAGRRGTVSQEDVADAYKRAARSKFEAWQSFYRDVEAARRRGVSDSAIRTAVEARGVSSAEAGAVMSGKFIPPRLSPALGKQMQAAKRQMPAEAAAEMRRAEGLVLTGRFE